MSTQCAEEKFKKLPAIVRVRPLPGTNHWTPLKAAFPSDPPLPRARPLTRSLTSFGSTAATVVQKNTLGVISPLRPEREGYIMPCFGSFQRKCLPSFSVRSFFYLPYCSYKTYRWVDECIVLLLLTCLRLYGFAVSMFGGKKGRRDRNPGSKKTKVRSILYTM